MKSSLLRLLCVLLCTAFTAIAADAPPANLDKMVQNAMKAFNAGDAKAFFADYSKSSSAIATPEIYKAMYEDMYKAKVGKFVSMTFVPAESSINDDAPLLIYAGKFEKGTGKIAVNFIKEDAGLKIIQVMIQPD